jgi:plasmid stabilization system protein ParE
MAEQQPREVQWTHKALGQVIEIKAYLMLRFGLKEVNQLFSLLRSFEQAVGRFPKMYGLSTRGPRQVRRAVLSKELSVYYRVHRGIVQVIACLDNRSGAA